MIRTQVSLDERDYAQAKQEAQALGIPVSEFVRRAIREFLPPNDSPWMRYAGFVGSRAPNPSHSVDDIVYGVYGLKH